MSLLDGLAAYWKFDEGTGTSAADATGNGNTGTLVGTVSWVSGFVTGEGAVNTVSGANYVSLTGAPVASLSQPFSVLLHVNSASVTATQTIFSEGSSSSDNPVFALLVPNTPTGKMRVLFRNNGGSSLIDKNGSIAVFDGNNHTILFRYDGSGNYETFIDGVKDTSLSGTFTPSGVLTLNRSAFGALARTSYTFPCPGNYGSAGRWTRRLDDDEAAALYNSGAGLSYDDFGGGGGTPITSDLGLATETDIASPLTIDKHKIFGLAVETEMAWPTAISRRISVGLTEEADTVFSISTSRAATLGMALESDNSFSIVIKKNTRIGLTTELDSAFSLNLPQHISIQLATEIDNSFPFPSNNPSFTSRSSRISFGFGIGF